MTMFKHARALGAALVIFTFATATASHADIKDYEFQLVSPTVKKASDATFAVRLVRKPDGKLVPDAVIFATRLDMGPDGMPTMATPLQQLPNTEAGVYRFKTDITMEGRWALSLSAKIQGENGTIQSKLIIKAVR